MTDWPCRAIMLGMVQANLIFTQAAVTPGPGISMIGAAGVAVTLSNSNNAGVTSWLYEFLSVPLNSGLALGQIGIGMTANFTPDNPATPGCYRVRLTVTGQDGTRASQIRNFAVLTTQGWLLPSFRAKADEMNFISVDEGWMEWLNRIFLSLSAGAPTDVLMSNVLFVDVNGDDATAVRGSLTNPFETIQAALDAALDGDVVKVGPGTFTEALVWPEIEISLEGASPFLTIIQGPLNLVPVTIAPATVVLEGFRISKMSIVSNGSSVLTCDCSAFPSSLDRRATIQDVSIFNVSMLDAVTFENGNFVDLDNVYVEGSVVFTNVAQASAQNCEFGGWTSAYTNVNPPSEGRLTHSVVDSYIGTLAVTDQARIFVDRDCVVEEIAASLTDTATNYGIVEFQGRVQTNVLIEFTFTEAGEKNAVKFDYAQIVGSFVVTAVGGIARCQAKARHATFKTTVARSIEAGGLTDLDIQESLFKQDALLASLDGGTIDRSVWKQVVPAATAMPHTMIFADSFGNPIPYPSRVGTGITLYPYSVIYESYSPVDYPLHPVSKNPDGVSHEFDAAGAVAEGNLEITIIRVHEPDPYVGPAM